MLEHVMQIKSMPWAKWFSTYYETEIPAWPITMAKLHRYNTMLCKV